MTLYTNRSTNEQNLITKAICFELRATKEKNPASNPYRTAVLAMKDGAAVWEAINEWTSGANSKERIDNNVLENACNG